MATPLCQNHEDQAAVFIGTFMADGTPIAVCDTCLVAFCAGMLEAMTGIDPAPFMAAVSEDASPTADGAGVAAPEQASSEADGDREAPSAEQPDEPPPSGDAGPPEATATESQTSVAGESGTPDAT